MIRRKGFTLVEVLISFAILAFLMAGVVMVLYLADLNWDTESGLLDLQQQARQAMDGMTREIRQSSLGDIAISDSTVSFKIPNSTYCFKYSLSNNQVIRQILDCPSLSVLAQKILADNINYLNFSLSGNILDIKLRASKAVRTRTVCFPAPCQESPKNLEEKVRLRN